MKIITLLRGSVILKNFFVTVLSVAGVGLNENLAFLTDTNYLLLWWRGIQSSDRPVKTCLFDGLFHYYQENIGKNQGIFLVSSVRFVILNKY